VLETEITDKCTNCGLCELMTSKPPEIIPKFSDSLAIGGIKVLNDTSTNVIRQNGRSVMVGNTIFGFSQRRAFKKLVCASRSRLYRMAYAWTHDAYLADDLVQQALCKALANQRQLRDMAAADAWLFRILANCLTDYRRARREITHGDDLALVENRTPETRTQEQQLVDKVRYAVSQLPEAQRQVVTLIDLEGFAYSSVASTLDIPVGTVMSRLCRGRQSLKKSLFDARAQLPTDQTATISKIRRIRDSSG